MQPYPPVGPVATRRPPKWLWLLPVLSIGLLAFVPPIAIAAKARTRRTWAWAIGLSAAWLVGFATIGSSESDSATSDLGGFIYFGTWIACVVYALVMGPKVPWPAKGAYVPAGPPPFDPNAAAVAGVHAGRQKRHEARELARRDPMMARDLRIGRPDLPRQYDDGGLVDVNSAPAEVMGQWLGLAPAEAAQVFDARQQLGRFEHAEDLVNLAGLEPSTFDRVSERVIVM
ncbi:ComEA family DNA-binding protein [Nocardioides hwasunensis]|uniref:Helix-hairpin-helix domain-containing protein n=1 Tax=Nocardioides hwasunensis TaxID=397258 RepID=A0ABR8MLL2_9ACTN|nr:helix-hairpin-helix domain-containing protein [Nocardioides hwasunensis]MBD3915690.1 helix-hairpin-helix domain-containing protein [Nocardioides hwasunensis]